MSRKPRGKHTENIRKYFYASAVCLEKGSLVGFGSLKFKKAPRSQMSISRRELTRNANDPKDDMRNGGGRLSFLENKMEITLAVHLISFTRKEHNFPQSFRMT